MAQQQFKPLILSVPTPAATFMFFTDGYEPPAAPRYTDQDVVKNQNGKFKWVYDNGPGFKIWSPFKLQLSNTPGFPGSATQQLADLLTLWNYVGIMGMQSPDNQLYNVIWADNSLERAFRIFPKSNLPVGQLEYSVTVQFEEA